MDWGMKFSQRRFREKQCDWFAKRGMNSGTLAVLLQLMERGILSFPSTTTYSTVVHRIGSLCCLILENLLITVCSSNPKVKKAYLKSDEAGCYHNSQLIVAARDVEEREVCHFRDTTFLRHSLERTYATGYYAP